MRIARPVSDLARSEAMYRDGLGWSVLGRFEDHAGFDGVMLGDRAVGHHFEFTWCRTHPVAPAPTVEDLLVVYLPQADAWQARREALLRAGFVEVASFNPYWSTHGVTFADHDGYRLVLQHAQWPP